MAGIKVDINPIAEERITLAEYMKEADAYLDQQEIKMCIRDSLNADGTAHHEQPPEAAEIRKKQKYPCNRRFRQRQDPVRCV